MSNGTTKNEVSENASEHTTNSDSDSEGTRLGRENDEFNAATSETGISENQENKATKIGSLSDFEKSLFEDENNQKVESVSNEDLLIEESEKTQEITQETQESNQEKDTKEAVKEAVKEVVKETVSTESKSKSKSETKSETDSTQTQTDQTIELTDVRQSEPETEAELTLSNTDNSDFGALLEESVKDYKEGDIVKGIVRGIEKTGVLVDINYKSDGFISNLEFSHDPEETPKKVLKLEDEIDVYIERLESKEGYIILSRKRAQYELAWTALHKVAKTNEEIEIRITSKVGGGLVVDYYGIKGFMPASQVVDGKDEASLEAYINTKMVVSVLKADRRRRKVIFSNKSVGSSPGSEAKTKLIEELEVGQIKDGKVTSIKDFGVFVDLGGIEGLVHISEISWTRVQHPSDILNVGDSISVFVLGVDKDQLKVSLGMKQLEKDPWVIVKENYEVGQMISGKISRVVPFGAFIQLENGLEGLIHISELSNEHIKSVEDVVAEGDEITARIIKLNTEEQRIGLSLKDLDSDSSQEESAEKSEEESSTESIEEDTEENTEEKAEEKSEDVSEKIEETVEVNQD